MANDLSRAQWRKSSYSGNTGNCVEVVTTESGVAIRDSKNRDGGVLVVSIRAWQELIHTFRSY